MMLIDPYRGGLPPIEVITAFKQAIVGDVVDVPAHNANDFLVVVARATYPDGPPATPSGWTSVASQAGGIVTTSFRIISKVDTAGTISTVTVSGANQLFGVIYRYANATGATSTAAEAGPATSFTLPSLTLTNTLGPSRVFPGLTIAQFTDGTDPSGHTRLWDNLDPNLGGGTIFGWDVAPPGSSYTGGSVTDLTNGYALTWAVEIMNGIG